MSLPKDMATLEARLWALAGERMLHEPVSALAQFADASTFAAIRALARRNDQPVSQLFGVPGLDAYHADAPPALWRSFARALLEWAGELASEPLVLAVDSVEEPPPVHHEPLLRWVDAQGVAERLEGPASVVRPLVSLPFLARGEHAFARYPTLRSLLDPRSSPRAHPALRDAARAYLAYCAGRKRRMEQRRERWSEAPELPAMALAAARLRALVACLTPSEPPPPMPARGLQVRIDEDALRVVLSYPDVVDSLGPAAHEVWVSLVEARGGQPLATSEPIGEARDAALRVAAELALDGLHDEAHPLHEPLRQALSSPRWSRLLEGLRELFEGAEPERSAPVDERVIFRLEGEAQVRISPIVQRRAKRGWTRGRAVDAQALLERAHLDERDRAAISAHARYGDADGALHHALVGHPRVVHASDASRSVRVRRAALEIRLEDAGGETWIRFRAGDLELEAHELLESLVDAETFARFAPAPWELVVAIVPEVLVASARLAARHATGLPRKADEVILALFARLPASIGLEVPPRMRGVRVEANAAPCLRLEPLPGGGLRAELWVRPLEGGATYRPGDGPRHLFVSKIGARRHSERDLGLERQRAEEVVLALHLDRAEPDGRASWLLSDPESALDLLARGRDLEGLRLEWPEGVRPWEIVARARATDLKVRTKRLTDWFALRGEVRVDEAAISLAAALAALRAGRRFVELDAGRFARIEDDLRSRLEALSDIVFEDRKELAIAPESAGLLAELIPDLEPDADFTEMRARLEEAGRLEPQMPELNATLRSYQREGVRWLQRTAAWARGACLADDMGLGKTVQALALLTDRASLGPALVVCPTSIADNWRTECERFAPGLRPHVYRGSERKRVAAELSGGDVLITSYDVLLRDVDELAERSWATLVLDEAQALKNPDARRRQAARRLPASFRLALTGTPVENHLGELWSIFDVLVPGLLGPREHFKARYSVAIERHGDPERLAALRRTLSPFLLRRKKEEVAPELPERTEVTRVVELSDPERARYEAERRLALEGLAGVGGDPKKRFAILAALTRLRRLACHPALIDPGTSLRSSKLDELLALADDLVREQHRALIFSQFTSHLALVRPTLEDAGHETLYLDGSTPAHERSKLVRRFQEGSAPFFLVSLKAGGTGLNLTAADTVIHLDPWWNPAAEDQASDRSHRIGQTRPVTIIRLVAQGTIEESVMELHAEKRELARSLLEGAEQNARLGTSELLTLLGA